MAERNARKERKCKRCGTAVLGTAKDMREHGKGCR